MNEDFKKEAKRQYLHYFRFWFIAVGVLLALVIVAGIVNSMKKNAPRGNLSAPAERVYDYADILTDEEEEKLRGYIAKKEKEYRADFVIMTFNQPVMGPEAMEKYGYDSVDWEENMMDIADDFWDENGYGYNSDWEGDGSILIDNRYPVKGEGGEWLSTSGRVEAAMSFWDVDDVLYAVDDYYESDPYRAYVAYIDGVCRYLNGTGGRLVTSGAYWLGAFIVSLIIALVYAFTHLQQNKAQDTVAVNAYVAGGKPVMRDSRDDFIRKSVVRRRIETSSSSGGGRSGGGGGGHHVSRSGASHGGGGHRH